MIWDHSLKPKIPSEQEKYTDKVGIFLISLCICIQEKWQFQNAERTDNGKTNRKHATNTKCNFKKYFSQVVNMNIFLKMTPLEMER